MSSNIAEEDKNIKKKGSQFKALFLKNGLLQAKQPCTNICQMITPVICLIFTYLIKELATQNLPSGALFDDDPYPYVFGDYTSLDNYSRTLFPNGTKSPSYSRKTPLQWYLFDCIEPNCDKTLLGKNDGSVIIPQPDNKTLLGSISNAPPRATVDNFTLNYYDNQMLWENKSLPFFLPSAYGNVNKDLYNNITIVEKSSYQFIKNGRSGLDSIPDGSVTIDILSKTKLKARLAANDIRELSLHRNNGVTALVETKKLLGIEAYANGTRQILTAYGFLTLQHYLASAFTRVVTNGKNIISGWIPMRQTDTSSSFVQSLINAVSALIFPLALSLLFPVMLYGLVLEKEEKLVQMMKMNGMKISTYWVVYIIFNFILSVITNAIFFILGSLVLQTKFFKETSPALLTVVAVGWILSQIGLAAFLQTLLDKARSANIVGYIFAIWTMMIASTLSIGVYQVPNQFPGWIQALPPFAFNRLFYLMLIDCSDAYCYTQISQISPQMQNCIFSLYGGAIFFFLLGAYLLQVLPQQFGVRQHPLFPFIALWRKITCQKRISYSRPQYDQFLEQFLLEDQQDPLSRSQRLLISQMEDTRDWPLIINNLRKLYIKQGHKGPYKAVKSFNLRVAAKQTFGLLGPNGAGKTTLINMLTGMINPDYGNAWIGGFDINSNISKAQLQMGVCPQFDLLWPQLTVEQHLRFYARLKGIPGNQLENKVKQAIQEVNLSNFKSFLSSSLSGGMKRRLSIAISLVGDPKIVFLDEPSTGLDPDNRRQIWEVLVRCQDKRALFLTTHMMQEADALCHRIGIITHGALRTVGNQLRLKKQYGQGYRLSLSLATRQKALVSMETLNLSGQNVNLQQEKENEQTLRRSISELVMNETQGDNRKIKQGLKIVYDYIADVFKGATIKRVLGSSAIFKIPSNYLLSEIFTQMHSVEQKLGITNVSITDSSLEDVFITVVLKYDNINDDDEQSDQIRLMTIYNSSEQKQQTPIMKLQAKKQEERDSISIKNRESVMSDEGFKRNNQED